MPKEDLEVVLADDCSTESYQDIVDKYLDKLNIKQVSTEYNCCPGNTRQCGVDAAAG
jgi:glycosyltransferase involved in cell wall biosynthesis